MKEKLKFIAEGAIFCLAGTAVVCGLIMYEEWRDETEQAGREDCEVVQTEPIKITICGSPDYFWRYSSENQERR